MRRNGCAPAAATVNVSLADAIGLPGGMAATSTSNRLALPMRRDSHRVASNRPSRFVSSYTAPLIVTAAVNGSSVASARAPTCSNTRQ